LICRGAEGTVVEGDDLATKIWGLGSDELRLKSPQPPRSSASFAPLPLEDNLDYLRVTSSALARHRDAVIDLAKPATFSPGAFDSVGGGLISFDGTYLSPAGYPRRHNICKSYQDMHLEKVTTASSKDCPEPALARELVARSRGLPQTLPPTSFARKSNLNSAAQSFIPATKDIDPERACVQQDPEFGDYDYTHTSRDSRRQRPSNSEFTPISTASPLWSPVFQSVPTIMSGDHDPRIYSPQTDLDSYSNKLITQQLSIEDFPIVQQRFHTEKGIKSSIETFYAQPYVANNSVCMKDANVVGGVHPSTLASCNSTEVESCERPYHLSHQQPRSFPMARLMQRRLSSVVEENISGSYELSRDKALRQVVLVPGQSKEISDEGESSSSSGR